MLEAVEWVLLLVTGLVLGAGFASRLADALSGSAADDRPTAHLVRYRSLRARFRPIWAGSVTGRLRRVYACLRAPRGW